jgi:hypothetical protein
MDQIEKLAADLAAQMLNSIKSQVEEQIKKTVVEMVTQRVNSAEVVAAIKDNVVDIFNASSRHFPFSENSIPGLAIDKSSLTITGDNVIGGTVANFASTGIDDKATSCQLTIMDVGTIFENTLYAAELEVKGDAVIDGNLIIKGEIPRDSQTYQNIIADVGAIAEATHDRVITQLKTESLDISKLTLGQRSIIEGNTLTNAVINSQLQQVGILRDLQTNGETLLSETLYATNKRVGVNTMDPATALSVWDEEIEIGIGKQSLNVAQIGTPRGQNLILSSNNQKNITLTADGTTVVPKLQIGNMQFTSAAAPPMVNAAKGTVVFNENPSLGGPLGWISLGDARWANFGIID